jgi:basic membrane protein A and related proteins
VKVRGIHPIAAILTLVALVGASCAKPPSGSKAAGGKNSNFIGCEVTDTGGVNDKSFNQTAHKGLVEAQKRMGIQAKVLESQTPNDYEPNIEAFVNQDCNLIVTVGFLLADATAKAAKENPDQKFAIVDFDYVTKSGKEITYKNVRELTFDTAQAAFLAGYLAAGTTKSGKVGTFGGVDIPPVTDYMNGFDGGINYYNKQNSGHVKLLGWNSKTANGLFTGDFSNQDNGRRVTESLLEEGADIIFPVAGPVGLGAAAAVKDAGNASMIWVDTDGCISAAEYCSLLMTSVEKKMDVAVFDTVKSVIDDNYKGGLYVGTLKNEGVGLAPYHRFNSKIPSSLKKKIDQIKKEIIGGKITVSDWYG